jgi:hypothetical protein
VTRSALAVDDRADRSRRLWVAAGAGCGLAGGGQAGAQGVQVSDGLVDLDDTGVEQAAYLRAWGGAAAVQVEDGADVVQGRSRVRARRMKVRVSMSCWSYRR